MLWGVYERFTERAREVLVLAQNAAHDLGHPDIRSEHLLLGLIAEHAGIAAWVLRAAGLRLDDTFELIAQMAPPDGEPATGQMRWSTGGTNVVELAREAGERRKVSFVGTEHLLLGLVEHVLSSRDGKILPRVFDEFAVKAEGLRAQVEQCVPLAGHGLSWMVRQQRHAFQIRGVQGAGFSDVLSQRPDSHFNRLSGRAVSVAMSEARSVVEVRDLLDAFSYLPDGAELLLEAGVKAPTLRRLQIDPVERGWTRFDASQDLLAAVTGAERLTLSTQREEVTVRDLLRSINAENQDVLTSMGWDITGLEPGDERTD